MDLLGLITFSNFIFVLSIAMIVCGAVWLFGIHFLSIVAILPVQVIELLLYGSLSFGIYRAPGFFGDLAHVWALLFACGLTATTLLTGARSKSGNTFLFNLVNMAIHGVTGAYVGSTLICGVSVAFLMAILGFDFGFGQGFIAVGYNERDIVPSATFVSGIVTFMSCFFKVNTAHTLTQMLLRF